MVVTGNSSMINKADHVARHASDRNRLGPDAAVEETVIQFNHARNSGWELLLVAEDHNDTEMNFLPRALWGPVTSCEKQDD